MFFNILFHINLWLLLLYILIGVLFFCEAYK